MKTSFDKLEALETLFMHAKLIAAGLGTIGSTGTLHLTQLLRTHHWIDITNVGVVHDVEWVCQSGQLMIRIIASHIDHVNRTTWWLQRNSVTGAFEFDVS